VSRASTRSVRGGAILRAHSKVRVGYGPHERVSDSVESTSTRRKASPFAGRRRKRVFGPFIVFGGEPPVPPARESATRVLGSYSSGGAHESRESSARVLSTHATQHERKLRVVRGSLVIGVPTSLRRSQLDDETPCACMPSGVTSLGGDVK